MRCLSRSRRARAMELAGTNLDPAPSNFHDRQRMDQRSIYSLYSTITLGVQGTAMASFRTLSEDERWALAFYVSALADDVADLTRGAELWQSGVGKTRFADLASLGDSNGQRDARRAWRRRRACAGLPAQPAPGVVMSSSELPLARSARLLRESLAAYQRGQTQSGTGSGGVSLSGWL